MTANKVIAKAKSYIGTKDDGNNKVKFNTEFYGREVSGDAYPWCVVFIWYIFKKLGAAVLFCAGQKVASCGVVIEKMVAQRHSWKETPKKGDLVIFDFSGNHAAHTHIGLVTEVINSTTFKTIEGNTGNSDYTNGGYVLEQTRYNRQVNCFIRPKYEAEKPVLDKNGYKKGDKTLGVLTLKQLLLIARKKGIVSAVFDNNQTFGDGTEKAVNQVLKKFDYKQTGVAGENFIKKLGELVKK